MSKQLIGAVVGLRMGKNHAAAMAKNEDIELKAVCDLSEEAAEAVLSSVREDGAEPRVYADYSLMLKEVKPDVLAVATPNRLHAAMAMEAAESGVRAICCEKPIAVDLGEARKMVRACREAGIFLIVNHQRRLGSDFQWMRERIESGSIGEVYLIRGNCAGDMLSDGTHLIDSALFLSGDIDWSWAFASYHREDSGGDESSGGGYHATGGWRFGHPIENGMFTVAELVNGVKIELLTGDLRDPKRPYHDIEVLGTNGGLWRSGDKLDENLFQRASGGNWEPVTAVDRTTSKATIPESYRRMVKLLSEGGTDDSHPLGADYSMRGFELLMGAYESARTNSVIKPPVTQDRYPLAVAIGLGEEDAS